MENIQTKIKDKSTDHSHNKLEGLTEAIDLGLLDTKTAEFYKTKGGFTGLKLPDKEYKRVSLRRALPMNEPSSFISVADEENKEIGLIRSLSELSNEQLSIVSDELDKRYYCPEVTTLKSVKDKMGYVYMELILSMRGETFEKSCAIKDVNKNIRMIDDNRLIIFDVDGNRYLIKSLHKLDKKSLRRLEPYLF